MKDEALELLSEIEENVNVCCAVTMDPDEVLELIDKLRKIIKENIKNG
jgi:3-deoxy-D-arabino-heptulosonate 7-phosphate (DAHP) synthase class II